MFIFGSNFSFEVHIPSKIFTKGKRDGWEVISDFLTNAHREDIEKHKQEKHEQTRKAHVACLIVQENDFVMPLHKFPMRLIWWHQRLGIELSWFSLWGSKYVK